MVSAYYIYFRDHVSQRMDYGELTNIVFSHYGGEWKKIARFFLSYFPILAVNKLNHLEINLRFVVLDS